MLSFPKILFTLAVILIVFYGAKMIGRRVTAAAKKTPKTRKTADSEPPRVETVDLSKCAVCDSFIADDARSCGRPDCPQGR